MAEVTVRRDGALTEIRLSRPHRRNAVDLGLADALHAAIAAAITESSAVVLAGDGPVFCSGGDVAALRHEEQVLAGVMLRMRGVVEMVGASPVPVIAHVEGLAVGGGVELAAACPLLVAHPRAAFHLVQTSLGVSPGWHGGAALHRRVGRGRALELLLRPRRLAADAAFQIGLVDAVMDDEDWAAFRTRLTSLDRELAEAVQGAVGGADDLARDDARFARLWHAPAHMAAVDRFLRRDRATGEGV